MKYLLTTLAFMASLASAHPGHDHSAWSAPFLHALWLAPIVVAAVATTYYVVKKIKK